MDNYIVNPKYPYTYTRTCYAVKCLQKRYSEIISAEKAGCSEQGRDIFLLRLGKGERRALVTAAIHGREYVTTGFLLKAVEFYAVLFCKKLLLQGVNIRRLLEKMSFYIVPQSNPDSVEITLRRAKPLVNTEDFSPYFYKDNARGVNLNANFPYFWEDVPQERKGGGLPASEKETRFLMKICRRYEFEKMISLHTRGGCVYWKDKGNGEIGGDKAFAEKLSRLCKLKLCAETKGVKAYSGGFENWFRCEFKRPAVCVELVNEENAPFDLCCRNFYDYTDWQNTKNMFLSLE
ncbi:MAG: hypothetical protein E7566_01625 [Ruminococcaceae bacterium]|nr:hypothetical protein [Oscillospiraceae bacterium]